MQLLYKDAKLQIGFRLGLIMSIDKYFTGAYYRKKSAKMKNFTFQRYWEKRKQRVQEAIWPAQREARIQEENLNHPERLAMLPYCSEGHGIEVGCGHRKTHENCVGVDILPPDSIGGIGCVKGEKIVADICTSGDDLHMFKDEELDFVVSRHNLEHYVDIIKTLQEWKRVLKPGGIMATVTPDETNINTIKLDISHKHAFTPESLSRYIHLIGGFEIIQLDVVIPNWSFICACKKLGS